MSNYSTIAAMVDEAEQHADTLSIDRIRAIEYYQGEMKDTPSDAGRSQMVTRDVRSVIKKVLPSILRTIIGSDEVVEFQPVEQGDEEDAEQASDYINYVVFPECDGRRAVEDAVHDALLLRNGILKVWFEEKKTVKVSTHTGLPETALGELISSDDVDVLEQSQTLEVIEGPEGPLEIPLYDVKIRRTVTQRGIKAAAVPRERFLIHPDAITLEDSIITGEKSTVTRSELVAMGHDRDLVASFPLAEHESEDEEADARKDDVQEGSDEIAWANQPVDYYDLYVRIDMDDDGIAELRHMCFAGGLKEANLLLDEECDEVQYYDLRCMTQPHQWEGISVADDVMDIQRVKTVLFRQTLDNIYWQNNPQPTVQKGAIVDMDAVYSPEFGKPVEVKAGIDVRTALGFTQVPFVARDSFGMMEYLDSEAQNRTGISDASSGLAPDALQNMTAKASAMIEQQGIGQTEMLVSTIADGLRRFFRGLLRLSIKHQDVPRTVRLRDEWVDFDPRYWNAEMDCTVNTGLGAGTRERDMQMMQAVLNKQEQLIGAFGPDNPFVKPENLSNALSKFAESAGLKTPSLYFAEPDPQEIAARMQAQSQQPSPEQMKMQAQMQLEQAKMQTNAAKEKAQMDADLMVKRAEIEAAARAQADKLASDAAIAKMKIDWDREKWAGELQLRQVEARQQREDDIMKHQAAMMREDSAKGQPDG